MSAPLAPQEAGWPLLLKGPRALLGVLRREDLDRQPPSMANASWLVGLPDQSCRIVQEQAAAAKPDA
jgi:hypothetical protein